MRRFLLLLCLAVPAFAQQNAIDPQVAGQYFQELKDLSDQDAGRLWGVRLYGPMLFADPATGNAVANQADKEGKLHAQGGVFVGQLPPEMPIANTGVDWAGVRWTMVMWPLPRNRRPRQQLMAHEALHRLQPQLRLTPLDSSNNHLDGRIGRTWLQLEWRALNRALATSGKARLAAIADALYFRALRRSLIPNAAINEDRLEANEGIAEYTGVKLSARYPEEARLVAGVILWNGPNRSPFTRSFAYVSGPAYGVLLDESGIPWRKQLKPDSDLGGLLAQAYYVAYPRGLVASAATRQCGQDEYLCCTRCVKKTEQCTVGCLAVQLDSAPSEAEAIARAQKHDGDEVIAQEKDREVRQQQVIAAARKRLIDGPVLVLPASPDVNYSFDPNGVTAIDDNTSVFDNVKVTDKWGVLSVTSGVLVVREKGHIARVQVPAPAKPEGTSIAGDGWKLDLKPGWKLVPGTRKGDWAVAKE